MERPLHVLIVEARFYADIADELARGATRVLDAAGATFEREEVPGAFEIPAAIAMGMEAMRHFPNRQHFDGFIALGCVIRGETSHYDYVCNESARALQDLAVRNCLALGYGILTVENQAQAWDRAAVEKKNKGGDVAEVCLAMIDLKRRFDLLST